MKSGNGSDIPQIGERGALLISSIPSAEDCAKNFLQGSDPNLIIAASLIGILGQMELHTERETVRIRNELEADARMAYPPEREKL